MIKLVGTSHVSKESIKLIDEHIKGVHIVALELDPQRLHALLSKQKTSKNPLIISQVGLLGYFFLVIAGFLQQKVGKITGLSPGSEMLHAYKKAKKQEIKLVLIDQDVRITLRNLSRIKFKDKIKLLREMFRPAPDYLRFDVKKIPKQEFIIKAMKYLKDRAPALHKALVDDRNHVMAKNLAILQLQNPDKDIMAVMGAGHIKEVNSLVIKYIKELTQKKTNEAS